MRVIQFKAHLFPSETGRARSERVLRLMLEALTTANEIYLAEHPQTPSLLRSGVRYAREPIGEEIWLSIPEVLAQGFGDCEDLAAWLCAELRAQGIAAVCDFYFRRLGATLVYHIIVRLPDGRTIDPSRMLGMGEVAA